MRINPIVAKDLKSIRDYIAEDNEENAAKTHKGDLWQIRKSSDVSWNGFGSFKTSQLLDRHKYAIWEDYVIIYKVDNEYVEIYRVINRYQDITRIFD